MLKIHEVTRADGSLSPVFLGFAASARELVLASDEDGSLVLPPGALGAVMQRYGRPVEPSEPLIPVAALELGEGVSLRHVRHLARYDVIARDFLVYEAPGAEALCALATTVAAALAHLARAARDAAT